ncbi:MAG: Hsp20/alpha crystallin family protein [Ktedonobacteraceae bacterium]|nr:Hsp20/alpha crystallin family protein [Ktedonobacteraceae bacterium]
MQESVKVQQIPVKMYRAAERLTVAAPMPGLLPEDIVVEVNSDSHLLLRGELRGMLKDIKELLVDEWSVGGYYRELALPDSVDAERANVTYRNGVVVVALPISTRTIPAILTLEKVGMDHGEYVGNAGHTQI